MLQQAPTQRSAMATQRTILCQSIQKFFRGSLATSSCPITPLPWLKSRKKSVFYIRMSIFSQHRACEIPEQGSLRDELRGRPIFLLLSLHAVTNTSFPRHMRPPASLVHPPYFPPTVYCTSSSSAQGP